VMHCLLQCVLPVSLVLNLYESARNFNCHQFYQLKKILHGNYIHIYVFSEQTATFVLYNINSLVFITEVEGVYSAVRTESLYKADMFRL
jgi:hypothetical protein